VNNVHFYDIYVFAISKAVQVRHGRCAAQRQQRFEESAGHPKFMRSLMLREAHTSHCSALFAPRRNTREIKPRLCNRLMNAARLGCMFVKRSLTLSGHATSVALEPEFWAVFDAAARTERRSLAGLIAEIDEGARNGPAAIERLPSLGVEAGSGQALNAVLAEA
jgi:hypothetical protein